jgi:thiosulfate/3-mercaptopyruvate sulfurtransferase
MYTHRITTAQLSKLESVLIFDCRHDLAQPEWGRAQYLVSHIPAAQFAALDGHLSGFKTGHNGRHPLPNRDDFLNWLAQQGASEDVQIVCYDQLDGMFAARLWWLCRWAGLVNVAVLEGGFAAWQAEQLPVTAMVREPVLAPVVNLPALETVVTAGKIMQQLNLQTCEGNHVSNTFTLVDARAVERYRGDVEPLDPVAGHIPYALNHPFKRNVDAQGYFVSDLRAAWTSTRIAAQQLPLVHQCGSGVTACHNILAQHVAGLTLPFEHSLLYAGSWSEWCSDSTRPVAIGA